MTQQSSHSYDAVVVGAGPNGLVAANVLADAGWSVLVVEEQPTPGGACRHTDALHPGYVTDLFSSFYPLGYASPVLRNLGLTDIGVRWVRSPAAFSHVLADGRSASVHTTPTKTAAELDAMKPGDGARWLAAYEDWLKVSSPFVSALLDPFPPLRAGISLGRTLGLSGITPFARHGLLDAWSMANEMFAGDAGRALLIGNAMHADITMSSPGSGILGWLLSMLGQQVGFPVPQGGSGRLVDALVGRGAARGVELVLGDAVTEVMVRDGRARGVVCASGREYAANRAVLADVPATTVYARLVDPSEVPSGFSQRVLDAFVWDHATVKVNWALDRRVPWTEAGPRTAGTVHIGGDPVDMADAAHSLAVGRVPTTPFVLFGQTAVADPSRAPRDAESAWAYTHLPRAVAEQPSVVDAAVEGMESAVERCAPGFLARVVARSVQSPADLEASDAGLSLGALNGGTAALHQMLVLRPLAGAGRPETPVDGLYLAGSSAHPGGGVHGACGHNAARAALLRHSWAGRPAAHAWRKLTQVSG